MTIFRQQILSISLSLVTFFVLMIVPLLDVWWMVLIVWSVELACISFFIKYLFAKQGRVLIQHLVLIYANTLFPLALLLLVEVSLVRTAIAFLSALMMYILSIGLGKETPHMVLFERKPLRRVRMMSWVFFTYILLTTSVALVLFFPNISQWGMFLIASISSSVIAMMIWQLYYDRPLREFLFWGGILTVISVESMWMFSQLPFGYLVSGAFLAWVWYDIQLLIRFHLSPRGVLWNKQRTFLMKNAVLFVLVLFFVRWL